MILSFINNTISNWSHLNAIDHKNRILDHKAVVLREDKPQRWNLGQVL